MNNTTLEQAIENANAHKQLGTENIHLSDAPYPWEYVVEVKAGSSFRLNISTDVHIKADHPCGLRFTWFVSLEDRSANGSGHHQVDVATIVATRIALGDTAARIQYEEYLSAIADSVEKHAYEGMEYIGRELTAVALIRKAEREPVK